MAARLAALSLLVSSTLVAATLDSSSVVSSGHHHRREEARRRLQKRQDAETTSAAEADPSSTASGAASPSGSSSANTAATSGTTTGSGTTVVTADGQPAPVSDDLIGGFAVVGNSGVSAQMMFLGDSKQVYILDKVENNPVTVGNHPAWATVYDLEANTAQPMDVYTNTFCAGGAPLANGTWVTIGGNLAVDSQGNSANWTNGGQAGNNSYGVHDGGMATRTLTPGQGSQWSEDPQYYLTTHRWYPTVITVEDGRALVMSGSIDGSFVNMDYLNNPTYEIWPKAAGESLRNMTILQNVIHENLYPVADMMPNGEILLHVGRKALMWDYKTNTETYLPDDPYAVRNYPASGSTVMLPIKREKDGSYKPKVIYCGGSNIATDQWLQPGLALIDIAADKTCISMTYGDNKWVDEDSMPEGRVLGNSILLPDGTMLVINGAGRGVAGYADVNQTVWANGDSLADDPVLTPAIYDDTKPKGKKWSRAGLKASAIPRMYHSTATLLPDGAVMIAGSNPHKDFNDNTTYPTEYRIETFYPLYYNKHRPFPSGMPSKLSYGGDPFTLTFSKDDLNTGMNTPGAGIKNAKTIKVVLMLTGFSTHALNFGQRMLELERTYTVDEASGTATVHVNQLPTNAAVFPPGTAWMFAVVDGVPSVGIQVMIGSGQIGEQPMGTYATLPRTVDPTGAASLGRGVSFGVVFGAVVAVAVALF